MRTRGCAFAAFRISLSGNAGDTTRMDTSNILFVGVKGHVVAFSKLDGTLLWKTKLRGGFSVGDRFVTVLVDGQRVYAHSYGELFCLDALSGQQLWTNNLEGLGYEMATLAVEGASASLQAALARYRRSKESAGDGGADGGGD